ncbi:MAG: hypothetical protein FJ395_12560 [Verrucomicrobia bacterium]|nr:hypothetical protein [Verrucomicrobiota bacterium]
MRMCTVILGLLLAAPLVGAAGAEPPVGRKLYVAKCASCHKLYDPAKYNETEWDSWMQKMRKKVPLTESQIADLNAYAAAARLTTNAVVKGGR